ncbi:DEAD/DEAH box helicase family protein [Mycoplasmopsis primatum]|uniref:DEAD/DEAH box helicase family protein n=1 Tax=Mycoplasmopsis primatum TaxID=55604 RepID=UPI000495BA52|nr:DEAD/DEAH box helicase family protein [Mycoplasmopsis primatum]
MNNKPFLFEKIKQANFYAFGYKGTDFFDELPRIIPSNLSPKFKLREYQKHAIKSFIWYFKSNKNRAIHNIFNMQTGSGKTVVIASLILYLWEQGYENFVIYADNKNRSLKLKKTLLDNKSKNYLFSSKIDFYGKNINTIEVNDFNNKSKDIKFKFITNIDNNINLIDKNSKMVFISYDNELIDQNNPIFKNFLTSHQSNLLLEFTNNLDLEDPVIRNNHAEKIIFNYDLPKFRKSLYMKAFNYVNLKADIWQKALSVMVISEYRKNLFRELGLLRKPAVMFIFNNENELKNFYSCFFNKILKIKKDDINKLSNLNIDELNNALNYFKLKDSSFKSLINAIKRNFTTNNTLIDFDNTIDKEYRVFFVSNQSRNLISESSIFDIVYIGSSFVQDDINIAKLISNNIAYFPFKVNSFDDIYIRKFDNDITNKYRALETLTYYYDDNSAIINKLQNIKLIDEQEDIKLRYILKDSFKNSSLYKNGFIYANKEEKLDSRLKVYLDEYERDNYYVYEQERDVDLSADVFTINIFFKDISYKLLLKAARCFKELNIKYLKTKFQNLQSVKEFLTDNNYLGNNCLKINAFRKITNDDIFKALMIAFDKIALYLLELIPATTGSKEFYPIKISQVFKEKIILLTEFQNNGFGVSQNDVNNSNYLDLNECNWYVYNDNYDSYIHKEFLKFFKQKLLPKLTSRSLNFFLLKNEGTANAALFSFEKGKKFIPSYILFIKKEASTYQIIIELKENNLLVKDDWQQNFLMQIEDVHKTAQGSQSISIIGLPFFNQDINMTLFESSFDKILDKFTL